MKYLLTLISIFCCKILFAQNIEMPTAKFITGDNAIYSYPSTDDDQWQEVKLPLSWEMQGLEKYDGYAWYRFHVILPESLKNNSLWKDSLRIYLGKIDDVSAVYFNAIKIGQAGSFPEDKGGYKTAWNTDQEYHVATNSPFIKWKAENIISVKVYDGGGAGGMFSGQPYVNMLDLIDGIKITTTNTAEKDGSTKTVVSFKNIFATTISGKCSISCFDEEDQVEISKAETTVSLKKDDVKLFYPVAVKGKNHVTYTYTFTETKTNKTVEVKSTPPYILTPAPSAAPRINGAKIFGVRPNSPVLYKIAATGKAPLQYRVEDLPEGLSINPANGVITGKLSRKGDYIMTVIVKNNIATAKRAFTISCGDIQALTPPMGWNSWNCWGLSVSDEKLKASAKAMMDKGLINHGWTYMNIDDGWEAETRNAAGEIVTNNKFPDMKKLGDWLHGNGLKFGIYSSPGTRTCGGYLGSYQHELQDANTYANWGIDYLKYDWCSYEDVHDAKDTSLASYKKPYEVMQDALQKQSRDIVYSLCQYGMKDVWEWGATVNGNCWRTTGDITDSWQSLSSIGFSQTKQYPYAQPGRWNDPDMMIVGQVGWSNNLHPTRLTPDEQYTHVSLWCMLSAPLLIGCDLSKLDNFTLNLLTNDEVIEVDQDPLGKQAKLVFKNETFQMWLKDLEDGSKALAIFNTSEKSDVMRLRWSEYGLATKQKVRDLWRQKDLGNFDTMFASSVAAHGVTLVKITAGN